MKSSRLFLLPLGFFSVIASRTEVGEFLRKRRHLLYPDPKESETKVQVLFGLGLPMEEEISMTLGYVLKCNYNLPYNSTDFDVDQSRRNRNRRSEDFTRWSLYRMVESAMSRFGGGKVCLLRAICEAASHPFDERHGLLGELFHLFLTPSATQENYEIYPDREYHAAEATGRAWPGVCPSLFHECQYNPLDYFSAVGPRTYN